MAPDIALGHDDTESDFMGHRPIDMQLRRGSVIRRFVFKKENLNLPVRIVGGGPEIVCAFSYYYRDLEAVDLAEQMNSIDIR